MLIGGALAALAVALGVWGQTNKAVRARLAVAAPVPAAQHDASVIRVQGKNTSIFRFLTTGASLAKIERNVMLAGQPDGWTARTVVTLKLGLTIGALFFLVMLVTSKPSFLAWGLGLLGIFVAYVAPDVIIQKRAEARQTSIQQELPDVLDQVSISIESGLGFEAAFAHIGERRTGPLADEIVRTVQDMRLGMSRRDAYQSLAARTDVDDLRRFVKSIVQAEQYGVSISSVVKTQAAEIRFRRRKRAEALAQKVPVKIVFPLLVCILPVLFIVILTPAVVSIAENVGAK